jgi:uncharacterized membrane protein
MKAFLAWLLGLKTFPDGHVEKFRLSLLHVPEGMEALVAALFGICAILFAWWIYRKRRSVLGRRRWVLMALRVAALALLFFLLLGPYLEMVCQDTARSTVAILVDNSRSMTIVDKRPTPDAVKRAAQALGIDPAAPPEEQRKAREATRLDLLRAALGRDGKGLVPALEGKFALKFYSFGREILPGPGHAAGLKEWLSSRNGTEPETRLGSAAETALDDLRGQPFAGMIVLSDGSSNGGADPGEAFAKAGRREVPVYFVGLGEEDARDVQVSFVAMRDIMFLDDPAPVTVKLRHWGCAGRRVRLTVSDEAGEVAATEVELGESGETTETLTIKPQRKGPLTYTVKAEPLEGELILDNNQKSKDVRVVDEKIRVLWVETVPRWEYRYAKNLVKRDRMRFDPKIILYEADPQIRGEEGLFLREFPQKDEELFGYHLVVIGDIEAMRLSEADMKRLRQYVSREGGSVIFLAGSVFGPAVWNGTPLQELLPVVVQPLGPRDKTDEIASPVTRPVRARRTAMGERHPFLFITDDREVTREAWEKYLLIYNRIDAERAKPGAQVLLETAEENPKPIIVASRYGSGTVLYLGSDELWRWRYRPGPLTHDRFWGSALQQTALARLLGESRRITLQLSREELGVGEEQAFTARVLTEGYQPAVDETLDVRVEREENGQVTERYAVRLNAIGKGAGLYEGKFFPGLPGRFTASLEYGGEKASAVFRAAVPQIEFENPALDRTRLTEWAKRTGGNVYDPWNLEELPKEVAAKARAAVIRFEDELWDAPLWAFLFVLLAGTEWFMRKRENLP